MINWFSETKNLKRRIFEQHAEYQRLVENIPEVVWRGNQRGDAIFISERVESIFGYTPEQVLSGGADLWFDRIHPEDRARVAREYFELFENGGRFDVQYRIQHRDGRWMWWHDRAVLVEDSSTGEKFADGLLSDITEMKRLEEQLAQSQKMEAVGQLAGGIAHDFNNLVQVISGYAELLERQVEHDLQAAKHVSRIKSAAESAASLTEQLLSFSRKQLQQSKALDLNDTIRHVCNMLGRVLGEHIELVLHVAHRATPVKGDPTQFERLLMNLALNARDAMPNGGKLIISTEVLAPEDINRSHPSDLPAAEYVLLTVSDTGLGMDATTLSRIFEPFFTTKERGQGTGLGLAAVYGIVTQSGGYIYASSELGRGSSFRIYLPLSHHDEVQEKTPSASLPSREAKELVLLVEDEPAVRDLARVFLEKLGYRVLCASDVHSAVAAMASSREKVDLLLTDVIMPGCSGRELAQKIRTQCPDLKVLYMTGYTDDVLLQHQVHHSRAVVLRKPFTKDQLSACVRAVLEEGAQELVSS